MKTMPIEGQPAGADFPVPEARRKSSVYESIPNDKRYELIKKVPYRPDPEPAAANRFSSARPLLLPRTL